MNSAYMSIRRKSTAHDLATLRLHPDGSRVQQSSVNTRKRTAGSTVVDSRGNWIAKDAGGKSSVKTRRNVSVRSDDVEREFIDLSDDEDAHNKGKGKERARDSKDTPQEPEWERLNTRTRQRLSFMHDLSFLDPPPVSLSSLEQSADHSDLGGPAISFPDPAPDLLKSIHHFASCFYRERGQLFDSSRDFRGKKKERKQSPGNVHIIAARAREHQSTSSEIEHTEMEDESTGEDESTEEVEDQSQVVDVEDSEGEQLKGKADIYRKDMYKAFDGSALMALGIVLQEYVAHTLSSGRRASDEARNPKRRRTEEDNFD